MENGKIAIPRGLVNGVGFGSTEFHVIRMKDSKILNKYYFYFLLQKGFRKLAEQHFTGTVGHRRVPTDFIKKVMVPLPPWKEQVRIVDKIEELFSRITQGAKNLQDFQGKLEQYYQSILISGFSGKLTEKWRQKNSTFRNAQSLLKNIHEEKKRLPKQRAPFSLPDTSALPKLPSTWIWVTIGDAFYVVLGQSPPSSSYNEIGEGMPFFQGSKEFQELYPINTKWCTKPGKIAEKGDVLLSVRAPVGDLNIAPFECCIGRGLAALRPLAGVNLLYLYFLLQESRRKLESKGTGTTFRAITGNVLRNHPVPLPPLDEIEQIVDKMRQVDYSIKINRKSVILSLKQVGIIKQSILKRAFLGALVPQDSTDEPPSLLLERISAEKVVPNPRQGRGRKKR